jgi:hypothetical protein
MILLVVEYMPLSQETLHYAVPADAIQSAKSRMSVAGFWRHFGS